MTRPHRSGRRLNPLLLFTAIPFALLVNSSQVHMTLQIERDGSAHRVIAVETAPYFKGEVPRWVGDVQAGRPWERTWRKDTGTTYSYTRDYRTQTLNEQSVNAELAIVDVRQNPLSFVTTYTWREEISFGYLYDSDRAAAGAAGSQLVYEIAMPGTVTEATVTESKSTGTKPGAQPEAKPETTALPASSAAVSPPRSRVAATPLFMTPAEAQQAPAAAPAAPATPAAPAAAPVAAPAAQPAAAPAAAPAAPAATPAATPTTPAAPAGTAATTPPPAGPGVTPPAAGAEGAPGAAPATPAGPDAAAGSQPAAPEAPKAKKSSVEDDGRTAVFTLMASQPTLTLNVTAQRVRWGYLLLVAYVLAFVAYQLCEGLKRAARRKPRKI
jgi:hypothetical protein